MANIETNKPTDKKSNGKKDWRDEPRTPVDGRPFSAMPVNVVKARAAECLVKKQEAIDAVTKLDQEWRDLSDELGAVSFSFHEGKDGPLPEVELAGIRFFPKRVRKSADESTDGRQRYELARRSGGADLL